MFSHNQLPPFSALGYHSLVNWRLEHSWVNQWMIPGPRSKTHPSVGAFSGQQTLYQDKTKRRGSVLLGLVGRPSRFSISLLLHEILLNAVPELAERNADKERQGMGPPPPLVRYGTYLPIQTPFIQSQERFEEFSLLIRRRLMVREPPGSNYPFPHLPLTTGSTVSPSTQLLCLM